MNKRALFVTPYYAPNIVGGAEISTQLIAENVREVDILTIGNKSGKRIYNGVDVYEEDAGILSTAWKKSLTAGRLDLSEKIYLNLAPQFVNQKRVKRYRNLFDHYDLVAINSNVEMLGRATVWEAARESSAKFALVLRDYTLIHKSISMIQLDTILQAKIRGYISAVDKIAAPSKYIVELHRATYPQMEHIQTSIIPNAIDIDFLSDRVNKENYIIYAGSICEHKGIVTLLNAFKRARNSYPDLELRVFGRGPLEAQCKAVEGVSVFNWLSREELYRHIARAKILVLPSESPEAFGRVLIEAIACGTLPIGSDSGAIPEVLNWDNALLFKAGNQSELSDKLIRLLRWSDEKYYNKIKEMQILFKKYQISAYKHAWTEFINDH